jgi:YHS domain-containing protein
MLRLLAYLFDLVIVVIVGRLLAWILKSVFGTTQTAGGNARSAPRRSSEAVKTGQTARDPVCGMFVSTELSQQLVEGNQTLHFCSRECMEQYQKNTARA